MDEQSHKHNFSMIAIVAIVAIVALVVLVMNANNKLNAPVDQNVGRTYTYPSSSSGGMGGYEQADSSLIEGKFFPGCIKVGELCSSDSVCCSGNCDGVSCAIAKPPENKCHWTGSTCDGGCDSSMSCKLLIEDGVCSCK